MTAERRLEPFSHILVQAIATHSGIAPLVVLVHEGTASLTRLGVLPVGGADEDFNDAVNRHIGRLAQLTVSQRIEYHQQVDITKDAPFLVQTLAEQAPADSIVERLASTDFAAELAAEGQPAVYLDDDGNIRHHNHLVEHLLLEAFENPTEENKATAERAVAGLQRRLDQLRRQVDAPLPESEVGDPLEDIYIRHHVAAPGPWTINRGTISDSLGRPFAVTGFAAFPARDPWIVDGKTADFITHSWEDVAVLLREVRHLSARVGYLEAALESAQACGAAAEAGPNELGTRLDDPETGRSRPRRRVRWRVTREELDDVRSQLAGFEERYGYPTARLDEVPEFQLPDGAGVDCDHPDLVTWAGLEARYSSMLADEEGAE
ncbi:hypothetical protein [Nocardioides sp. SYSU DS0651]|uniref:hypothetical protein n=1 Tax=Nocardioides sp. SYSU DS0651 TaxID=3415955 RepID=UPI003F4C4DBE